MINHIVQISQRALQLPPIDGLCRFAGVFEGDAEVGAMSAGGFALLDCGGCVADLRVREEVSWVSESGKGWVRGEWCEGWACAMPRR